MIYTTITALLLAAYAWYKYLNEYRINDMNTEAFYTILELGRGQEINLEHSETGEIVRIKKL